MTFSTHVAFASVLYLGGTTLLGYAVAWVNRFYRARFGLIPAQ